FHRLADERFARIDNLTQRRGIATGLIRTFSKPLAASRAVRVADVRGQRVEKQARLLERSNRIPERLLDLFAVCREQTVQRIRVAGVTTEPQPILVGELQQHSVAIGAGERRWLGNVLESRFHWMFPFR